LDFGPIQLGLSAHVNGAPDRQRPLTDWDLHQILTNWSTKCLW
jgi:hypothetical protein